MRTWAINPQGAPVNSEKYVFGNEAKAREKRARRFGIPVTIFYIIASDDAEEI